MSSSAYSRMPPEGKPLASLDILMSNGEMIFWIYIAVASPSTVGLVAIIISVKVFVLIFSRKINFSI